MLGWGGIQPFLLLNLTSVKLRIKICWVTKIKALNKLDKNLIKIGSQSADILLKRTNLARTFVAGINGTLTVGIYDKDAPRNLPLMVVHKQVSNS